MSSRETILSRLRQQQRDSSDLPNIQFAPTNHLAKQFSENLKSVGGFCYFVPDHASLTEKIRGLEVWKVAKKTVSRVAGVPGNLDVTDLSDPHQLRDLDLAVLPGVFGVAENAAIWLDMNSLGPLRAVFVIPQHLMLVLRSDQIVSTMHDAYKRLDLSQHNFGVFVSGPSKTADIEQSLVIGAHGARSCSVFLTG